MTIVSVPVAYPLDAEYTLPPHLVPFAIRLADEGIPVNVIARAFKQPSENVRESLSDALNSGTLSEMPGSDWPPTAKKADHLPFNFSKSMEEKELIINCIQAFKVTPLQAALLIVLIKRDKSDKDTLHGVVERRRMTRQQNPLSLEQTDPKIVDVVICNLRKKLRPFGLEIKTLWGWGYFISKEHRELATTKINEQVDA